MRIRFAVCDDENIENEYISSLLHRWAQQQDIAIDIQTFPSAEAFLFAYDDDKRFDILLLDIQMKDMDGIALAKEIRKDNASLQIIFITGFPDFISEGYEVSALHYLMKPVNPDKLFSVLTRAKAILDKPDKSILISFDGETVRLPVCDIMCVEAQGHYVILTTPTASYKSRLSISEIETALGDGFFRCQRSFIVGLKYVKRINKTAIILESGKEVPLSRELYNQANQAIIRYF